MRFFVKHFLMKLKLNWRYALYPFVVSCTLELHATKSVKAQIATSLLGISHAKDDTLKNTLSYKTFVH